MGPRRVIALVLLVVGMASAAANAGDLDLLSAAVVYLRSAKPEMRAVGSEVYELGIRKPGEGSFKPLMPFVGTGFLMASGDELFLVTARHVANELGPGSGVVLRGDLAQPLEVSLQELAGGDAANKLVWRTHAAVDVAVLPLTPKERILATLRGHFIPAAMLSPASPSRDVTLTVLGFPLGLGTSGPFSPISRETKAASGPFLHGELGIIVLLQDPSISGYSGAPVFDLGQPAFAGGLRVTVREGGPRCVGIISATLFDQTGGKLGAMVPAQAILELLGQDKPAAAQAGG